MMPDDPVVNLLQTTGTGGLWALAKLAYLTAFLLYIGFAIVVISQIKRMTLTVISSLSPQLQIFSWIHLGLAVLAFVLALVVL